MATIIEENIKYSLLIYSQRLNEKQAENLKILVKKGIKVIIVTNSGIKNGKFSELEEFIKERLLQIYTVEERVQNEFCIADGKIKEDEKIEKFLKKIPGFNYEQYKVEHFGKEAPLCVEASAGTGKTTVMIDRIMYLLHTREDIKLSSIVMITFTVDATKNMRGKLYKQLMLRYRLTREKKYVKWLEELSLLRINTIHSFSKNIISRLGSLIGYGRNVSVRKFNYERKKIITKAVDSFFKKKNIKEEVISKLNIPLYKIINIVNRFWETFEREGLGLEEIEKLNFGRSEEESRFINEMFSQIFSNIAAEMINFKRKENVIGLEDMVRDVQCIIKKQNILDYIDSIGEIKYLFVDEFQDTDSSQIELTAWLHNVLNANLFVVGDIKQSIYRFRGATYTAFSELQEKLNIKAETISLIKNYRTSESILDELDTLFKIWGKRNLLVYGKNKNDRIEAVKLGGVKPIVRKTTKKDNDIKNSFIEVLKKRINEGDKEIAILVRTNNEVRKIQKWCEESNIVCHIEIGGTFFSSDAVREFRDLIGAFLFSNEPKFKTNLINSSYFIKKISNKDIIDAQGDKETLNKLTDDIFSKSGMIKYRTEFRVKPVLAVVRQILKERKPEIVYYLRKKTELTAGGMEMEKAEEFAYNNALKYAKNLEYLLEILHNQFSLEFLSLSRIYNYLQLQIQTNREIDEINPGIDKEKNRIVCMTVHKSKGLEFDTVIIPLTKRKFRFENPTEILSVNEEDNIYVGWQIYDKEKGSFCNDNYHDREMYKLEDEETVKEESRLLYVALTRAKKRLIYIKSDYKKENTWAELL